MTRSGCVHESCCLEFSIRKKKGVEQLRPKQKASSLNFKKKKQNLLQLMEEKFKADQNHILSMTIELVKSWKRI